MQGPPFNDRVESEVELRQIMGLPSELVRHKVIDHLDVHCQHFIELSPYLLMSTPDAKGECDASPRGDEPGFVKVIDERRLVIPDRPGNPRMDSLSNILDYPHIGLIFLIPGLEETLRITGLAYITRDLDLLSDMEVNGRIPLVGIGVEVKECYIHCAKSIKRSRLWQSDLVAESRTITESSEDISGSRKIARTDGRKGCRIAIRELHETSVLSRVSGREHRFIIPQGRVACEEHGSAIPEGVELGHQRLHGRSALGQTIRHVTK